MVEFKPGAGDFVEQFYDPQAPKSEQDRTTAGGQGQYGNYQGGMGSDTATNNSNLWDTQNTGESAGFFGDLAGGKMGKDFMHGRFDVPGIQYAAHAYDPAQAAGQITNQDQMRYNQMAGNVQNRATPQMQAAAAGQSQFAGQQAGFMGELQNRALGNGPSVAELQQREGISDAIQAQRAMAVGSANPAAAGRNAALAGGQAMTHGISNAAQLRAGEMQQAGQAYMGALGQARGQDQALALANAGYQQGAGQQNLSAQLQAQGQKDAMEQYYRSQGFSQDEARQKAAYEREALKAQQAIETQQINADIAKANAEAQAKNTSLGPSLIGNIIGGIAGG